MKNRNVDEENLPEQKPNHSTWQHRKKIITKKIGLDIDLENREIHFNEELKHLPFRFSSNNIDSFISNHVHPNDLEKVIESLKQAQQGVEKPIRFNFVHPNVSKALKYEFHYQIVYARYAQTKLQGVLVKVNSCRKIRK